MCLADKFANAILGCFNENKETSVHQVIKEQFREKVIAYGHVKNSGEVKEGVLFKDGSFYLIVSGKPPVIEQGSISADNLIYAMLHYHPFAELEKKH